MRRRCILDYNLFNINHATSDFFRNGRSFVEDYPRKTEGEMSPSVLFKKAKCKADNY